MKPRRFIRVLTFGLFAATGFVPATQAQTLTVLHTFTGTPDGASPLVGLVADSAHNVYGTTQLGGSSGFGTVYKLNATGKETVLYSFKGGADGEFPYAGALVRDSSANLYGTTEVGGASNKGTVFRVSGTGKETVLYSFTGGSDGGIPYGGLIRDGSGNLYGTTYFGGSFNDGTVFVLDAGDEESVLHSFRGPPTDGQYSYAGLLRDSKGNLYGTNYQGGTFGEGAIFRVDPSENETVLYNFKGTPDGQLPYAGLVSYKGGLYGTTVQGGTSGAGTVFKFDQTGKESILYSFTGGADGGLPLGGLVLDSIGNLYGTTYIGGAFGVGAVFKVDTTGKESVLYSFTGGADGKYPYFVVLLRDKAGDLYGTTSAGGGTGCGCGTVFKLSP